MERLTTKIKIKEDDNIAKTLYHIPREYMSEAKHKLANLEDIEQELGISLEVLFKALKDGVWIREYPEDEPSFHSVGISCVKGRWFISTDFDRIMNVNCFKSAWALTKEELE